MAESGEQGNGSAPQPTPPVQSWTWAPTEEESQRYHEWKNYTLGHLVSCRMGVQPGWLQAELQQQTGDMIPLDKMGLPVANIKYFLYPMAMLWNLLMFRDVNGSLYVFINESAVPEEMENIRKLVLGQRKGFGDYPLRSDGKYIPPHKILNFQDYRPKPEPPSALDLIMANVDRLPDPVKSRSRRKEHEGSGGETGAAKAKPPSKPKSSSAPGHSKAKALPDPRPHQQIVYSTHSFFPIEPKDKGKGSEMDADDRAGAAALVKAPNLTPGPAVVEIEATTTEKATEEVGVGPTSGIESGGSLPLTAEELKSESTSIRHEKEVKEEESIPVPVPHERKHRGRKLDIRQTIRKFLELRRKMIEAARNPEAKKVEIEETPVPNVMKKENTAKMVPGQERGKSDNLVGGSKASAPERAKNKNGTAPTPAVVTSKALPPGIMSRREFYGKLYADQLKSTPDGSARKSISYHKKWAARLAEGQRRKQQFLIDSGQGQSDAVGKSSVPEVDPVDPEGFKISAPAPPPPSLGSQAITLKQEDEFKVIKKEDTIDKPQQAPNFDLDFQQERDDEESAVLLKPAPLVKDRDTLMLGNENYIPRSGKRYPSILERRRAAGGLGSSKTLEIT